MSLPTTRYLYLRCLFLFYERQLDQLIIRLEWEIICVEVRVVKCFNAIAVYVMWFTLKSDIIMGLVGVDNNVIVMEERHCFATFKSLKIDVERLLIDPLRFVILICISDLTLFTHS